MEDLGNLNNGPGAEKRLPLPGNRIVGDPDSPVAVAVIGNAQVRIPKEHYRILGTLRSANIGVEKIIINILSEPRIRFLIVCGKEDGHFPGDALLCLGRNGVDGDMNIIGCQAQFPCLPDLTPAMVERFREQVVVIDLLHPKDCDGEIDWDDPVMVFDDRRTEELVEAASDCAQRDPGPFPDGALDIEVMGLDQDDMDIGETMNQEVGRMTDLMLRMPDDDLTIRSLNVTVSDECPTVFDPVEGLVLRVPTVAFHQRFKSYMDGDE